MSAPLNAVLDGDRAVVSRAVLRGWRIDPVIAQLRLSSALSGVQLPPHTPAVPIVVIRKLSSRLPRGLLEGSVVVRSMVWEQSLRETLAAQLARAARPARGDAATNSDAVQFADESEFLACLGRDWAQGRCGAWWWRALFPRGIEEAQLVRTWRERIGASPMALMALHEANCAVPFLRRLQSSSAIALAMDLATAFGLAGVCDVLAGGTRYTRSPAGDHAAAERARQVNTDATGGAPEPPWNEWVSQGDVGALHIYAKCLLGIALTLAHAPQRARSAQFSRCLAVWLRHEERSDNGGGTNRVAPVRTTEIAVRRVSEPEHRPDPARTQAIPARAPAVRSESAHAVKRVARKHVKVADGRAATERMTKSDAQPRDEVRPAKSTLPDRSNAAMRGPSAAAMRVEPSVRAADGRRALRSGPGDVATDDVEAIDTAFGGVFYLVNVALALGLYGDFSRPMQPGLKLSIWDFLALTGDWLTRGCLRGDPLWSLLARLAGRSIDETPGRDFSPASDWQVPASWLRGFSRAARWTWSVAHGRLCVEHPAGFVVANIALRGHGARRRLERVLRRYQEHAPAEVVRGRPLRGRAGKGTGRMERWLDFLVEYLRARLRLALASAEEADVGAALCAHRARIALRPASIDVSMDLESLPIAIRMAGLDRDPGWVPAAGRSLRFQFE